MAIEIPPTVRWNDAAVRIIDQTLLPTEYREIDLVELDEVVEAIQSLRVRGAPAIGIAGAMGLVASLQRFVDRPAAEFRERLEGHAKEIIAARPTGANLKWAVDRMVETARRADDASLSNDALLGILRSEATRILEEDQAMCRAIGEHGLSLLTEGCTVMTHCNAGALATGGLGTALAPMYVAKERGLDFRVVATETRPLLQGSRLTVWELDRAEIDVTLVTDSTAATAMRDLGVDLVIVGADRIVANGDVANKVGTYGLAIAAAHHGIPFYVAAPTSTFDLGLDSGEGIPIEERGSDEVSRGFGRQTAPDGVGTFTPAFDVTPADLIAGLITEKGVLRPPYTVSLAGLCDE